jgi:hypothetical protein
MANYESIRLEKGMYTGDFTANLEKLDPSDNYRETPLENMDAFQRQLKRFDIRVSGNRSDRIEKFFQSSDSSVLFPEYIARAVKQGMVEADMLSNVVATTTQVDAPDYRPLTVDYNGQQTTAFPIVGEGEEIPAYALKNGDRLVPLKKRGRVINSSYEALRFHRIDLFTVFLRQLGGQLAREQFADAIEVLHESDARSFTLSGELEYGDLLRLWAGLQPFKLTTLIAGHGSVTEIMNIPELCDSNGGLNFHATGRIVTPLGAALIPSASVTDESVTALDKNSALEMITAGGVMLESGRLIDRQLDSAAITTLAGFSKIFPEARVILK